MKRITVKAKTVFPAVEKVDSFEDIPGPLVVDVPATHRFVLRRAEHEYVGVARGALDRVIRTLKEAEETTTALAHVGYAALGAAASTIIGYVGWNPPPDGAECKHLLFLGLAGTFLGVGTCCLCLQRIRDNHQRSNFRHLREELAEIATGSQVLEDKQTPVPRYGSGPGLR